MLFLVLLLGTTLCTAKGNNGDKTSEPNGMTMGESKSVIPPASLESSQTPVMEACPSICCGMDVLKQLLVQLTQDQKEIASWRGDLLKGLSQLVQEQREVSSGQGEVIKLLKAMKDQGTQQLSDLKNLARHQSLLVENHQALLLQVSRISTHLQDLRDKKPGLSSASN